MRPACQTWPGVTRGFPALAPACARASIRRRRSSERCTAARTEIARMADDTGGPPRQGRGMPANPPATSVTCDDGVSAVGHRDAVERRATVERRAAVEHRDEHRGPDRRARHPARARDPRHARQQRLDLHRARRPRRVDLRRLRHGGSGAARAAGAGQRQVPRAADPAVRGGAGAAVPVHGAARPAVAGPVRAARRDPVRRGPGALRARLRVRRPDGVRDRVPARRLPDRAQ